MCFCDGSTADELKAGLCAPGSGAAMILSTCEYDGLVAGLQACFVLGTVLVLEHQKAFSLGHRAGDILRILSPDGTGSCLLFK